MSIHSSYKARIKEVRQETADTKTYLLASGNVLCGHPGQFNMVGYPGVGEVPISLSHIPRNGNGGFGFGHTIKFVGRVTNFLSQFKEGDEFFLRGPFGRGWPIEKAERRHLLIVSGGLGIAPLRPVIEMAGALNSTGVTLLYGARNPGEILFSGEFDGWEKKGVRIHLAVDEPEKEWAGSVGFVTELIKSIELESKDTTAFICGPEIMARIAIRELMAKGVSPARVYVSVERRMRCGVGLCGHCQHGPWFACKNGPVFSYQEIKGFPDAVL